MQPEPSFGIPRLDIAELTVRQAGMPPIEGIGMMARAGGVTALIGPAGAGRATLLAAVAGAVPVRHGEMRLDGRPFHRLPGRRRFDLGIAMVRADRLPPPGATLFEAVAIAQVLAQRPAWAWLRRPLAAVGEHGRREVGQLLARLGLGELADHPVTGLPLSHRRRLRLALAVVGRPRLLLADRPWRGLMRQERRQHADLLRSLCEDGMAVLLVEDDLELVAELATQVVVLHRGRLVAQGPPAQIGSSGEVRGIFAGEAAGWP
ncbi:MAG TPA: ATP-binding cassette domain-containing protein [Geminicoccaceae bacterium]|nr:ATP-binding cassette domain-containing protein [Geminicoccus sp.]HMU52980.1 ATP-binding cassette domain-containing protein [Geminicoccaceae bacterium]